MLLATLAALLGVALPARVGAFGGECPLQPPFTQGDVLVAIADPSFSPSFVFDVSADGTYVFGAGDVLSEHL